MLLIVADPVQKSTLSREGSVSGVSPQMRTAWELTRRIAVRPYVKKSAAEADGRVHAGSANNYPLTHALSPLCPETPWYIHLTDTAGRFRLLCFDFDGKDNAGHSSPELVDLAVDEAEALSLELQRLAIAHVLCESSSSGGRHIWVALVDGVDVDVTRALGIAAKANYRQLDHGMLSNGVRGGVPTGGARPPLSPHRNGSTSRVLRGDVDALATPSTTLQQLLQLTEQLTLQAPPVRPELSIANGPADSGHRSHRELAAWGARHMATTGGGSNPSWTGWMCLLAAADAGWSFNDVARAAATAPGMETYRTKNNGTSGRVPRGRAQMHARLESQWAKATAAAALRAPLPPREDNRDLRDLAELVAGARAVLESFRISPGRWGATLGRASERSTLAALTYLTLLTGKRVVAAAGRDLGPMGAVGKTTAARALRALQEAGAVELVRAHSGMNASEWRLGPAFSTAHDRTRTQPVPNAAPPAELFNERRVLLDALERELTDTRHDLFTYAGLGHFAGKVYAQLQPGRHATLDDVARQLGMTSRHVIASLSLLRKHRLIVKVRDGWARARRDLRAAAARLLDVAGILAARAETYQVDRELWSWWQAEYATMTATPRSRPRRPHVSSRPLFDAPAATERVWPRYPRDRDGMADHRTARQHVRDGHLSPTSRIQLAA